LDPIGASPSDPRAIEAPVAAKRAAKSRKPGPTRRRAARAPRKAKAETVGLEPSQCVSGEMSPEVRDLVERVEREGGAPLSAYRDPFGGHGVVFAVLPIARVEPTPFQRDLSDAHYKRLAEVITKTNRFLDPIIAVTAPDRGFWTPNGRHRLEAMRRLGAKAISALVVPEREIAWQILALNTEKAHNLKERSLEVIRIYRGLIAEDGTRSESTFAFYLEDPSYVTLGACYEKRSRFAGGAYHPVLRRTEHFIDDRLTDAVEAHEKLADAVLDLEDKVSAAVARLKERGLTSPYLRSFVVARINPLRWIQGELPPAERVIAQMRDRAAKFNADRVKQDDLARMGGGVADEE
jgi:ParB family transcriptional regulator, chromosome partitioning protein